MNTLPLKLEDLEPKETTFTLSGTKDKKLTLCPFSLRIRAWCLNKYTPEGLQEIFEKQKILEIAEIAYYMLKEKEEFNSLESFMDAILSIKDQINVITALLGAIGIGEPEIEKINNSLPQSKEEVKKKVILRKKTGEKSSTP
jgi:hypothetical protein